MNLMPEFLIVQLGIKVQVTPINIAMLIALGLCVAVVWHWFKRRT
jgi:hypothetical protein